MSPDELLDLAIGLETAVWQALVDGDADDDEALLAEEFLGVYPTGFAGRADHAGQLAAGPTVVDYSISRPSVLDVAEGWLLLSYEAHYRRPTSPEEERMFVSSLWKRVGERWLNVFSQDTPAAEGPP